MHPHPQFSQSSQPSHPPQPPHLNQAYSYTQNQYPSATMPPPPSARYDHAQYYQQPYQQHSQQYPPQYPNYSAPTYPNVPYSQNSYYSTPAPQYHPSPVAPPAAHLAPPAPVHAAPAPLKVSMPDTSTSTTPTPSSPKSKSSSCVEIKKELSSPSSKKNSNIAPDQTNSRVYTPAHWVRKKFEDLTDHEQKTFLEGFKRNKLSSVMKYYGNFDKNDLEDLSEFISLHMELASNLPNLTNYAPETSAVADATKQEENITNMDDTGKDAVPSAAEQHFDKSQSSGGRMPKLEQNIGVNNNSHQMESSDGNNAVRSDIRPHSGENGASASGAGEGAAGAARAADFSEYESIMATNSNNCNSNSNSSNHANAMNSMNSMSSHNGAQTEPYLQNTLMNPSSRLSRLQAFTFATADTVASDSCDEDGTTSKNAKMSQTFKCPIKGCTKTFPKYHGMRVHLGQMHSQHGQKRNQMKDKDKGKEKEKKESKKKRHCVTKSLPHKHCFKCPKCDFTTDKRVGLSMHFTKLHRSEVLKPYQCNSCKRSFETNTQLAVHQRHSRERGKCKTIAEILTDTKYKKYRL